MMQRFKSALIAALAGAFIWFALPGFALESQARIVRLSYVEGTVEIDRNIGQGFEKAIVNMPITQGTVLRTGADGRAEVQFENGSTVRLVPDSEVAFEQLKLQDSGAKVSHVVVNSGTAYFHLRHKGHDEFVVAFANRDIVLRKDAEFRVETGNSDVRLAVFKGDVNVEGAGEQVTVKKGDSLTFNRSSGEYSVAKNIQPSEYDKWSKDRDQYEEQYSSSSYVSDYPYYYGRGDLSYYGNYWYMPGYGYLWQPYGIGYGWNPFLNGAWCWYPGFGYTWVSTYPWGWLPYRYGSWVFVPGWGWGWTPGSNWNTWTVVPRVVDPPPSFVKPKPPHNHPQNRTIVVTNPPAPGSQVWRRDSRGRVSSVQPTPLPAQPRGSMTPTGPITSSTEKTGTVVTPATPKAPTPGVKSQPGRSPAMDRPANQGPVMSVPPSSRPGVSAPRPGPVSTPPASASPRSFHRPAVPPAVSRPVGFSVMSSPGVSHGYAPRMGSAGMHGSMGGAFHGGSRPASR
ncbi:MAG: FecR domain-containing protein [Terriglobales bacterium]